MDSGHMALSIYFNWMSSKWGKLLDSQPRQEKYMSVKDYYDQFCTWRNQLEAANYIGDEEWYVDDFISGLKIDLMVRVSRHKWIRRLSDALRRAEIEETFLSWEENTVLVDVDEDFEDEIQGAESACGESDDLDVQIENDPGKTVSPNADHKVFDELSQPNFTTTTSYTMIDEELDVRCVLNSQNRATFYQIFGDSENRALKMFNKLNGLVFTGLNSLPETLIPVEFVMVRNAYQVFYKMLQLSCVWPLLEIYGAKFYIPLIDYVPRVFDPGTSKSFKDIGYVVTFNMLLSSLCMYEHEVGYMESMNIRVCAIKNESILSFDPGGCSCHSTSSGNRVVNFTSQDFKGIENLDRGHNLEVREAKLSIEDQSMHLLEQRNEENIGLAIILLKVRFSEMAMFMFDSRHLMGCASVNPSEMSRHSIFESWAKMVVFLFDPGGRASRSSILLPLISTKLPVMLRVDDLVDGVMVKRPTVIYVSTSCGTYYLAHMLGNIIPIVKAGVAAILYDWDAWHIYTTTKIPREYIKAEANAMAISSESFVWDPGLGVIFFLTCSVGLTLVISLFLYILGVKDGFEGEGKRMICNEEMIICMEHDMRKVVLHW